MLLLNVQVILEFLFITYSSRVLYILVHHLLTTFNSNYLSITAAAVNHTYDDLYIYLIKGFLTYLFTGR